MLQKCSTKNVNTKLGIDFGFLFQFLYVLAVSNISQFIFLFPIFF